MRLPARILAVAAAALLAAAPAQAAGSRTVTFRVRLVQEQTFRHHLASDGSDHSNDTFSTTLKLFRVGSGGTVPPKAPASTMAFTWGPLQGNCSGFVARCRGTTNIRTLTKLPEGTIRAGGKHVSITNGIVVRVQGGTGLYKGARGTITIGSAAAAEAVFALRLPA